MSIFGIASQECSLTVCRCVTEVSLEGNKSSCFTLVLQLHAGGGGAHLDAFIWVSKIFQKTNLFVWNCHSSGQCPLRDWRYCSHICYTTDTTAPGVVNVHFDECFVGWKFSVVACRWVRHQLPQCALSYFPELLPVSFNQEQQLACTETELYRKIFAFRCILCTI